MALDSNLRMAILRRSLEEKLLLELYSTDSRPNEFSVGWLIALSDEVYVAATVDDLGRADDFHAGYVDDLFAVASGGEYLEAISKMMMGHLDQWPDSPCAPDMEEILSQARERKEIVTLIHRNDVDYHGIVVALDRDYIALESYSPAGFSEGQHVFKRDHIQLVAFGGPEQRTIAKLIAPPA